MVAVSHVVVLLSIINLSESKLLPFTLPDNDNLLKCLNYIITTSFTQFEKLVYVDINYDRQDIIQTIHSIQNIKIISKTTKARMMILDQSYVIAVENFENFTLSFEEMAMDAAWDPGGRFLIIFKDLEKTDYRFVFDTLLKMHIIDVLLINSNTDPELYTYNPFENFGCGFRYDEIIKIGQCSTIQDKEIFQNKLVTGLKNCTFKAECLVTPPFTVDLTKDKNKKIPGIEEFTLREISALEKFKINLTYAKAIAFSKMYKNMTAIGLLGSLQAGRVDFVFGAMLLTKVRAMSFDYIYAHLSNVDDIRYVVRKATAVSSWKNIYLEFNVKVWFAIVITFVLYYFIFVALVKTSDKGLVIIKMVAYLFGNSYKIRGTRLTKCLFICWVWFTYLIATYHQSGYVSLMNNPVLNYQISKEEHIYKYHLKACVDKALIDYLKSINDHSIKNNLEECQKLFETMIYVSQSEDKYALTTKLFYAYHKYSFYNEEGDTTLYLFNRPFSKLIYTIYTYKGFPLTERFYIHILRLRENGLIDRHIKLLFRSNRKKYNFIKSKSNVKIIIPWYLLGCGHLLSFGVLLAELLIKKIL